MSTPRTIAGAAGLAAILLALAGCGGGGDDEASGGGTTAGGCEQVDAPEPRDDGGQQAPTRPLDPNATYTLTFVTNCGSFTVTLDQKTAPKSTASLVSLAEAGFYDDTLFHRIIPGFVIQGGDPTQQGAGGPGYSTTDVPPPDTTYDKGDMAMAKTQLEPPGTAGSQFFVMTADFPLKPEYAIAGKVTEGLDVVETIGQFGDESGTPSETVVISSVEVTES